GRPGYFERERRTEDGHAVSEIRGAVDRIENPTGSLGHLLTSTELLTENAVIRKAPGNQRSEHLLDCDVDLGDQVDLPFAIDPDAPADPPHHHVPGVNNRLDGGRHEERIPRHPSGFGEVSVGGSLPHADFHPAAGSPLQADVVHEAANEKDPAAAGAQ